MKLKILTALPVFLFALLLGLAPHMALAQDTAGTTAAAVPKAEIDHTVFDAGKIPPSGDVVHEFPVKNVGTADLIILDVVPGCGCSVASKPEAPIAPGETGLVTITVTIYPEWAGQHLNKAAHMTTNDPAAQNVRLTITGDILPAPDQQEVKPGLETN